MSVTDIISGLKIHRVIVWPLVLSIVAFSAFGNEKKSLIPKTGDEQLSVPDPRPKIEFVEMNTEHTEGDEDNKKKDFRFVDMNDNRPTVKRVRKVAPDVTGISLITGCVIAGTAFLCLPELIFSECKFGDASFTCPTKEMEENYLLLDNPLTMLISVFTGAAVLLKN